MQASTSKKKRFRPGELAPITGVYIVNHGMRHRESHEVVIIRGEQLPVCRACKLNVSYEILRPISHITHDWDFSGPHNLIVRPKQQDFRDTRMFRRVNVQWPLTLELSSGSDAGVIQGHSTDLSAGGIGAIIRTKLSPQYQTVLVNICINMGAESLAFSGYLRYQAGQRYGFEFTNVGTGERAAIRRLMETQLHRQRPFPAE
ncbi:MAG TPA: PilZ domain-containing protein [Candidatus Angelobacter sp.]